MRRLFALCLAATALTGLAACDRDKDVVDANTVTPVPDATPTPAPAGDADQTPRCGGEKAIKTGDGRWVCP